MDEFCYHIDVRLKSAFNSQCNGSSNIIYWSYTDTENMQSLQIFNTSVWS